MWDVTVRFGLVWFGLVRGTETTYVRFRKRLWARLKISPEDHNCQGNNNKHIAKVLERSRIRETTLAIGLTQKKVRQSPV